LRGNGIGDIDELLILTVRRENSRLCDLG